jgi:syntaxin 5
METSAVLILALEMKDRTTEFHAIVESLQARSSSVLPIEKSRLLDSHGSSMSKSDFTRASSTIAKEIQSLTSKLGRLATLAKKKSIFDDNPAEINELIYVIKQDIAKVNKQIGQLSDYLNKTVKSNNNSNVQSSEHSKQVVSSLTTKLAVTSNEFKGLLEIRTANMKEQKSRRDQYSMQDLLLPSSDSPLYNPEKKSTPQGSSDHDTVIDLGGIQQSQALMTSNSVANMEYLESRSQAIDSIEATIAELGQIYQNFAQVLAGQREMVQRIDDNIMDMQVNVEGAHNQLLKYYQSISSNRTLMLKMFAVLIVFFMAFIVMT